MYTTTEVPAGSVEPISFLQFQENISKQMNLPVGSFELRYKDDEGDVIAISSDIELQEAVRQASARTPAVIEVIVETRQAKEEKKTEEEKEQRAAKIQEHAEQLSHPPEGISEIVIHQAVCSNCQFPIVGIRYKCAVCPHFDLCEICEMMDNSHPVDHPLIKAKRPLSPEFTHIFNLSYGLHNASRSVEKGIHKASDGLHQFGTNVQHYGAYIGTNVQQYGSQIKQTWTEHQPQIDAARQRAYEKWTEVKEQVKVISENMKVKAKEFSEALKKESNEWFKETNYPASAPTATTSTAPSTAPVLIPTPAPVPTHSSSPVSSSPTPLHLSNQHPSAPCTPEPAAPAPAPAPVTTTAVQEPAPTTTPTPNPFEQQLAALASMGFTDVNRNTIFLQRYNGDVNSCAEALLDS